MQQEKTDEGRRAWMKAAIAVGGAGGLLLGGCASVIGPRTVTLSEDRLMEVLGRRFPFRNRYLQTVDVLVATPRLHFLPESNRIATELQLTASERLLNRSWRGVMGLSNGLRFEPSDTRVRLTELRVDRLDISDGGDLMERQLARVAIPLAEQMLHDVPIHRFRSEELRGAVRGLQYWPGGIQVTRSGVEITLNPSRSA